MFCKKVAERIMGASKSGVGVSKIGGPQHSTLNSRIFIIRTPK